MSCSFDVCGGATEATVEVRECSVEMTLSKRVSRRDCATVSWSWRVKRAVRM